MPQMPNPVVPRPRRVAEIQVVGKGWYGQTMAYVYPLSQYHQDNIRAQAEYDGVDAFSRQAFDRWLTTNAGDFQAITDFRAIVGNEEIPWQECLVGMKSVCFAGVLDVLQVDVTTDNVRDSKDWGTL